MPSLPLDEIDLLHRSRTSATSCARRSSRRRGRAGDGLLGDRGRGQAAEVPADVPRLRACASSTRSTCYPTWTSISTSCSTTSTRSIPDVEHICVSARTGEGSSAWRDWLRRTAAARARRSHDRGGTALTGGCGRARRARRRQRRVSSAPRPSAWRGSAIAWRERFARGGRLIAVRRDSPPARSDVRHVAVEFVHPVIVGKRALPAIGLTGEGGDLAAQLGLLAAGETS